jgi:hypothetical protein
VPMISLDGIFTPYRGEMGMVVICFVRCWGNYI